MPDQRARVIYQIEVDATNALRQLGSVSKNTARTAKSVETLNKRLANTGRFLRDAFIGGSIIASARQLVRSFVQITDAAADLNARLAGASGGPQNATAVLEDLFNIAQRLGVPLESLGSSFQKLQAAVPNAPLSDLSFSLETVSQILATTGAGVQATNSVLLQLNQALGTGRLRGDEFRSVFENAPQLLRAWAQALGRGEEALTTLRDEEAFTTESFIRLNAEIRRLAEESIGLTEPAETVARGLQRIGNAFLFFFSQGSDSALAPLVEILNRLADSVVPVLEASFASLIPVFDLFLRTAELASDVLVSVSESFDTVTIALTGAKDQVDPFVSEWEEAFLVKIPSTIDVLANVATTTVATVAAAVGAIVRTALLTPLLLIDQVRIGWLKLRQLVSDDALDAELQGQIDSISGNNRLQNWIEGNTNAFENLRNSVRGLTDSFGGFERRRNEIINKNIAGSIFAGDFEGGTLPGSIPSPGTSNSKASRDAARSAERAARDLERFREQVRQATQNLFELEIQQQSTADAFTRDFNRSLEDEIRALDEELALLKLTGDARDELADKFALEADIRRLNVKLIEEETKALKDQNPFRIDALEQAIGRLSGGAGAERIAKQRQVRAAQAAKEAADEYEAAFRETFSGVEDLLKDVFTGNIDAAVTWGERIKGILDGVIGSFVDKLLDETFNALAKNFAQSAVGGGGSGGGIFGAIGDLFGIGGGGTSASSAAPAGGGGGGFFGGGFGSLAGFGLGSLAGSFFGGAFDSDTGTAINSPLDPLPDVPGLGAPNISIINNGEPLQVDSVNQRSNGDYQLIVSSAVAQTRSVYERDMRRGYGGFAESVTNNTSAQRTV